MATTGCCGVKKQKLHHNCRGVVNGHLSTSTNCINNMHNNHQNSSLSLANKSAHNTSMANNHKSNGSLMNGDTARSNSTSVLNHLDSAMEQDDDDDDDRSDRIFDRHQKTANKDSGPSSGTRSHDFRTALQNGAVRSQPTGSRSPSVPRVVNKEMVTFCFETLESYLHAKEPPKTPKFPNEHFPLFVTWKTGKDRKLRGCIGTFHCTSLHTGLREYAVTSACKDSRFEPINPDEFNRLHCSVSLLMDFEMADHYLDWEIGIHGIRIEFSSERGSKKAATYLPEVAVEQGWNHLQTVDSLLRKGGFKGSITPDIRASVCVIRFQSEKLSISYAEYVAHRQEKEKEHQQNHYSNGYSTQNGYHHSNGGSSSSSSGGPSKHGSRFFASLGGSSSSANSNHHHRYPTRASDHRPWAPPSVHSNSTHNHPPSGAARYLPLPSHPYLPPPM